MIHSQELVLTSRSTFTFTIDNPEHQDIDLKEYVIKLSYGTSNLESFFDVFDGIKLQIEGQDRRDVNDTMMCGRIAEILNGIYRERDIEGFQTGIMSCKDGMCVIPLCSMFLFLPRTTESNIAFHVTVADLARVTDVRMQILSRYDRSLEIPEDIDLVLRKLTWFCACEDEVNAAIVNVDATVERVPNRMFLFFSNPHRRFSARNKYPTSISVRSEAKKILRTSDSTGSFHINRLISNAKCPYVRYLDLPRESIDPGKVYVTVYMSTALSSSSRITVMFVTDTI